MWKARPEDNRMTAVNPSQPAPTASASAPAAPAASKDLHRPAVEARSNDVGHIGKSVVIRGELSGNEDLYLDGEVEGNINLRDHKLVIGPNARIKAAISAREVVIHGRIDGNVTASERVELKRSSTLCGDVSTHRIVVEDGAVFKGSIDIKEQREAKTEVRKPAITAPAAVTQSAVVNSTPTLSASSGLQASFLEPK
jgi:cytoskeletal protein CcmA (bactofilin family)